MLRAALSVILFGLAFVPQLAEAQTRVGEFRDWVVGCDNRRDCRAVGFRGRHDSQVGALAIDRAADADAAPRLWFLLDAAPAAGSSVEVFADDRSLGRLVIGTSLTARDDDRLAFDLVDAALGRAVLEALRRAGRLRLAVEGADRPLDISLDGASAALLFMDDRQRRLGTVTALVRRGDRPAAAVPAPPALGPEPRTRADPGWRALPPSLPNAVRQRVHPADDSCDADNPSQARALGRVAADLVLVEALCLRGAYNFSHVYHLWNDRTGRVTPVAFPVPEGVEPGTRQDLLTNPSFDEQSLTITSFAKGRGLGDCGSSGAWRWDGRAFRLVRYHYMPQCHGLPPGDWITLHRSE